MSNLNSLFDNIKMMYLVNIKQYSVTQNFFILMFLIMFGFILNNDSCYIMFENIIKNIIDYLSFFQPKKNVIILEGKRCLKVSSFITKTDDLFSNRFTAFWYYISNNMFENNGIYSLKEFATSQNIYDDFGDPKSSRQSKKNFDNDELEYTNRDIFVVDQNRSFKIKNDIYCCVIKNKNRHDDSKTSSSSSYEMENITIEIYSYSVSLKKLHNFIDEICNNYYMELDKIRNNKKFIYTLIGNSNSNDNNYEKDVWDECEFNSTRNFSNLFFEDKKKLLTKLNFFINNKSWYEYEGHPYTFGIGLHGPPGTGKTSIIKCIANKLNRHIIVIPLNKINTQREFSEYFFEQFYNRKNTKKIDFNDKIIVFEDIDCMTDIVKRRNFNNTNNTNDTNNTNNTNNSNNKEYDSSDGGEIIDKNDKDNFTANTIAQNKLLNKIAKNLDCNHDDNLVVDFDRKKDDKITLSFILNIIDGIRETPGRILIITSNDYNSLDPALIRPGRIDMTLEMKNANIDIIKEMYNHYYNDIIPEDTENKLRDHLVSPAKIVNIRLENEKREDFLSALEREFI